MLHSSSALGAAADAAQIDSVPDANDVTDNTPLRTSGSGGIAAALVDSRRAIAETLQQLRAQEQAQRESERQRRDIQDELTKSIVKIMHLDTQDYDRILIHTQTVTQQNAIAIIQEQMKMLEATYQHAKKELAAIPDKKLRHECAQMEKRARDDALALLREHLQRLDSSARSQSAGPRGGNNTSNSTYAVLPTIEKQAGGGSGDLRGTVARNHKNSPPNYREVMEAIRKIQRERKALVDPYMANLKLARLWRSINDHERALEDYTKACRSLSEKQLAQIPVVDSHDRAHVLEQQRLRKREALQFLFLRSLQLKERKEAAELMAKYLALSRDSERGKTLAYLEAILRKQEYIEDPTLATPDAVTQSILCSGSLGFLTDFHFELLQEMLAASPTDAYLLDAVERMHVRRRAYEPAKQLSDRFVKLPQVKRCSLFSSFGEFECQ